MRRPFHGGARASWTTWARILGLVVLVAGSSVAPARRSPWLFACVVLGVGFPAYLWSEPAPLATLRPPGPTGSAMSGLRLTGVVSLWSSAALTTWLLWP